MSLQYPITNSAMWLEKKKKKKKNVRHHMITIISEFSANTQGLKISEEKVLSSNDICKQLDF